MSQDEVLRVAVAPDVPRKRFDDVAYELGWDVVEFGAGTDTEPREDVFETQDGETEIVAVVDPLIDLFYLTFSGPEAEKASAAVRKQLETVDVLEAIDRYRDGESADDRVLGLLLLGVARPPEPDTQVLDVLEEALAEKTKSVRRAAVIAAGYTGWDEVRPLLQRVRDDDGDADVRRAAKTMLEGLAESG